MSLSRAWMQQLYRASGTALLVPGAMIAALVVLALAGGFTGVGSLGQVLSGPAPSATAARFAQSQSGSRASARLPALFAAGASAVTLLASTGSGATGSGTTGPGVGAPNAPSRSPVGGHGINPGAGAQAPSTHHHGPRPTLVDSVVGAATAVTSQVPSPAGPLASQALQAVAQAVDQILPPNDQASAAPRAILRRLPLK
jgi:hypothetical protein